MGNLIPQHVLSDLAEIFGGTIPDCVDLPDTTKDFLVKTALENPTEELNSAMDDFWDDRFLLSLYNHSAEFAVKRLQDDLYILLESDIQDAIDDYNDADDEDWPRTEFWGMVE